MLKKLIFANIKVFIALTIVYFLGFLILFLIIYPGNFDFLMPLALATLLYIYFAVYYLLGLIILNIFHYNKIILHQPGVYLFSILLTNVILFFKYGETFFSIGFVKVLLVVNILSVILNYLTYRIFSEGILGS